MQATPPATPAGATLRPLGIGDVIDRVFGIYRARALGLFVLGLILFVGLVIAWIVMGIAFALSARSTFERVSSVAGDPAALMTSSAFLELMGGFFLFIIIGWLITLLVGAIFTGAVIDAAAATHLGQQRSLAQSFTVGFQSALRIFFAGVLASLAVTAIGIIYNVLAALIDNGLVILVLTLAYFFAIFYVEASWFVSPVVATIERHGPVSSLRRSWQLATGFRWRIVGLFLLLIVLFLVLLFLAIFIVGLVAASNQGAGIVLGFIALFAAVPLWMPLFFGTMTVLYYDLRVRKEGLDLQLAAEAMPRA